MKYYKYIGEGYYQFTNGKVYREDSRGDTNDSINDVNGWIASGMKNNYELVDIDVKFSVDQKVICVDPIGYLVDRQVYTVKSIELDSLGDIGIEVAECDNIAGFTSGYNQDRFRPFNVTFDLDYNDMMTLDLLLDLASEMNVIPDDFEKLEAKIGNQLLNQM